jgi:DNA mismatch repair protein MutL
MSRIRILPEAVANRIAAGEVIERPASVVKELVENALDASAHSVRVEVESGGKRLVRVSDDGCGMNHDDALLAFERHATSKLRTADDLLSIATLGFRGEALPSMASVSRLTLETRAATDAEGTRVDFAGGKMLGVKPAGLPVGTAVSVADLFYCVPARRKFLKSDTTELGHIASLVTHYALAHPDKHFTLKTPTQDILDAAPVESLAERVYQVFGRQALDELLEIPTAAAPFRAAITEPELEPDQVSAQMRVTGFVSRPQVQRTNRNAIFIFVNRRLVRDRLILHAIHEAYRNIMPPNVFPAVLLFLEMPATEVDVNVHPSKIEVRFRHPQFVHDFARDSIRMALTRARPIAAFPTAAAADVGAGPPPPGSGPAQAGPYTGVAAAAAGAAPARAVIPPMAPLEGVEGFQLTEAPLSPEAQRFTFEVASSEEPVGAGPAPPTGPAAVGANFSSPPQASSHEARPAAQAQPVSPESIADLKPLGQVNNSFIVAVNSEGLWIIDQHVAHERVLFEQHLRARRAGAVTGQRMLVPLVAELAPRQLVIFEQIAEELRANGFEVEPMGPRSVAIQATPAGIAASDAERLLTQILDGVGQEDSTISMDGLQAKIAASTSCHAAIKVNMPLDQTKMEWLLAELARTEAPMSCPHGRPIVLRYSTREIEKAFKRI